MRRLGLGALAVALIAAALGPAVSSAAKGPTYTPKLLLEAEDQAGQDHHRLRGRNFFIKHIHYSFYNGKEAGGTGKAFANICLPSCAEGHFVKYPVKFRLTKPRKNSCGTVVHPAERFSRSKRSDFHLDKPDRPHPAMRHVRDVSICTLRRGSPCRGSIARAAGY